MVRALTQEQMWTASWCAVAVSFPWSNAFMSIATGLLGLVALLTLLHPNRRPSTGRSTRLSGAALVTLVALSGMSALWSADPFLAVNDARIKLPLAVGGLVLLALPEAMILSAPFKRIVLKCAVFSAGCAAWVIVGMDLLDGLPHGGRAASRFISHIRFGIWWAVLLPFAAAWLSRPWAMLAAACAALTWFWTESISGLLCGVLTMAWWGPMLLSGPLPEAHWIPKRVVWIGLGTITCMLTMVALGVRVALPSDFPDADTLPKVTAQGEPYLHLTERRVTENGHFVWVEVAWGELGLTWQSRHELPFDEVKGRLIRFLSSKGLPKDRQGVEALSEEEIEAVAAGATSVVEWREVGWSRRWNRICFNWGQWLDGRRMGESSILDRSVYQSTAWSAIRAMPLGAHVVGVGTGNGQGALMDAYEREHPAWPPSMRHRPHNQWLSLWLEQGWIGLLLLIGAGFAAGARPIGFPGLLVLGLSFCFEDTLETQAGVTMALWVLVLPCFLASRGTTD